MSVSETVERRIEIIADLMRSGRYKRGKDADRLAKEWDLPVNKVRILTATASKRVRAEMSSAEKESAAVTVMTALEEVISTSLEEAASLADGGAYTDAARVRAVAVGASKELVAVVGIGRPDESPWAGLSVHEQLERIAMAREKLDALEAGIRTRSLLELPQGILEE
jgi:hypothetical protein